MLLELEPLESRESPAGIDLAAQVAALQIPANLPPAGQALFVQYKTILGVDIQAMNLVQANFGQPGASAAQQLAGMELDALIFQQVSQQFDTLLTDLAQLSISGTLPPS